MEDLECDEKEVKDDTLPVTKLNGLKGLRVKRIYYKVGKRTKQQFKQLELDLSQTEYKDKKFSGWKTGGIVNEKKNQKN